MNNKNPDFSNIMKGYPQYYWEDNLMKKTTDEEEIDLNDLCTMCKKDYPACGGDAYCHAGANFIPKKKTK
jgi:hypothetical protein